MEKVYGSINRFKETLSDLTEVAKVQKQLSEEPEPVNLAQVVEDFVLDLEAPIVESKAQLQVPLAGCPDIRFSKKNLKSIVYNLLSNAIKFRSPSRLPEVVWTYYI